MMRAGRGGRWFFSGLGVTLLLATSVLVHWPTGVAEFTLDDSDFIQVNASIRSFSSAWDAMLAPFPPDQPTRGLYRPLTNLSYAVDYALSGDDARGYHRTNVVLYLAIVLLVYRLARRYLDSPGFALAAALVYSVHPAHTAAVDAVAGRSELLSLLFGSTSILLFLRAVSAAGSGLLALGGSLLAFALACMSKETGVVLPGILLFHVLLFHPPRSDGERARRNRALRFLAAFLLVVGGYLIARTGALGRFTPESAVLAGQPWSVRLLTMGAVFFEYLRLLFYPRVLQVDFYYLDTVGMHSGPSVPATLGLAALALYVALLAAVLVRHLRASAGDEGATRSRAVAIVALAIFGIFLLPVSHVLDIGALMAERFLLAPSLGFVLLVVLAGRALLRRGLADSRQRTAVAAVTLGVLAVVGGWRSRARAVEWRDSVRLWQATAAAIPWDTRPYSNLATAYLQRGELEPAQAALERALAADPRNLMAIGNLGAVQLQRGDSAGAAATFERMLAEQPQNFIAWNNLGLAEALRQRHTEAKECYERALELNPNYVPARDNLRQSLLAIEAAQRVLAQQLDAAAGSQDPLLLRRLSTACTVVGDHARAAELADRAARAEQR